MENQLFGLYEGLDGIGEVSGRTGFRDFLILSWSNAFSPYKSRSPV